MTAMRHVAALMASAGLACLVSSPGLQAVDTPHDDPLAPAAWTDPVADDADDPAIWIDAARPERSLILGTNKARAPRGALVVFGLDGKTRQTIDGIDRPNNVDVQQGVILGGRPRDIAIVTERMQHRLRVFEIDRDTGRLAGAGSIPVLGGMAGEGAEPMGIAIYARPADGAVFAIVAPKTGAETNYLWQYRLDAGPDGQITGALVRRFGNFSRIGGEPGDTGEIEAVVADDARGYVYYSDERFGIRKWHADPDHPEAGRELAVIGREGYAGDREGLAIWTPAEGPGYLVSTDQIAGGSVFRFYPRDGRAGDPHDQDRPVHVVRSTADDTDGIDVWADPLPGYPRGLLVAMNSRARNFALFRMKKMVN